jgi:TolA-binding protein
MTRQTINLLGGVVVLGIALLGVFLGALPRWQAADQAEATRRTVASQNQTQEIRIVALGEQRRQLSTLQSQVAALKQQIASGAHLEQLIELASDLPGEARLRSITPGQASAPGMPASPGASTTPAPSTAPSEGTAAMAGTAATAGAAAFEALPVTIVIDLRRADDAPQVLDKLRAGPRLLAIDQAMLAPSGAASKGPAYSLTVSGQVFLNQAVSP